MPTKKLLLKNSVFIFISYVVTAIAQTFVYIYASKILGNELFGVWSFLYSGALVVGLSNIGLPNLIITYTSKFLAEKNYFKLYQYLIHSIIIFFISFPIVLSIALFIFYFGIKGLKIQSLSNTTFLLFSVLFFLQNLTNILLAFVDGLQKTYIRAIIQLISNIFFFIASWILIHQGNINSIVNCQIILYIIQVTSAIFFILKFWKLSPTTKSTNRLFSFDIIKEIFRKSINYFFISISTIFFEPLSRYLIGKYLGIGTIAYYEITSRIIGGVKSLFVNVIQVIFPYLSYRLSDDNFDKFEVLKKITNAVFIVSVGCFSILPILLFIIGDKLFILPTSSVYYLILVVSASSFMNVICTPSYFLSLALKVSKLNLWHHISFFIILILGLIPLLIFGKYNLILYLPSFAYFFGSYFMIYLTKIFIQTTQKIFEKIGITLLLMLITNYLLFALYVQSVSITIGICICISLLIFILIYAKALLNFYKENKILFSQNNIQN